MLYVEKYNIDYYRRFGVRMAKDDIEKYEELLNLKNQIEVQLEDIRNNGDEHTSERIRKLHNHLEKKGKLPSNTDIDEDLKSLHKINKGLTAYQRFKKAFSQDVDIDSGRLVGLTDGIFGMVMTLLIFGMALPEIELLTAGDFLAFIQSSLPTIGVTLISFILLASFWIYHHEFIKVKSVNFPYLWINIFFLASISFIPFSTSMIGSYSHFFLAEVIFGINIFITLIFFMVMFWYANRRGFLERELSDIEKKYTYHTFYMIMGFTVVVNLLDFNISGNFIYLFFLVPIISTIRDIRYKMKT